MPSNPVPIPPRRPPLRQGELIRDGLRDENAEREGPLPIPACLFYACWRRWGAPTLTPSLSLSFPSLHPPLECSSCSLPSCSFISRTRNAPILLLLLLLLLLFVFFFPRWLRQMGRACQPPSQRGILAVTGPGSQYCGSVYCGSPQPVTRFTAKGQFIETWGAPPQQPADHDCMILGLCSPPRPRTRKKKTKNKDEEEDEEKRKKKKKKKKQQQQQQQQSQSPSQQLNG
ncbi:hypothetical protein AAL_06085 [Moelleriella libera RCEF 2490]|uniref:Uncharacterized protein n=1 Tax=Moelleriella libera RCEF 2490 TaxID=1081109 RepID=A0A167ZBZ4_9HYPO|nr:hypothetical protein AAL_06085 [Moelleriella libera RCEF 2490]